MVSLICMSHSFQFNTILQNATSAFLVAILLTLVALLMPFFGAYAHTFGGCPLHMYVTWEVFFFLCNIIVGIHILLSFPFEFMTIGFGKICFKVCSPPTFFLANPFCYQHFISSLNILCSMINIGLMLCVDFRNIIVDTRPILYSVARHGCESWVSKYNRVFETWT